MFLDLECIFCCEKNLVIRHVDTCVWQVVCTNCGGAGPYGECRHSARHRYVRVNHIPCN
jgi:hypothetical protein